MSSDVYTLNSDVFSKKAMIKEPHKKTAISIAVVLLLIVVLLIIGYVSSVINRSESVNTEENMRMQIVNLLSSGSSVSVSPEEVDKIVNQLSASSAVQSSLEDRDEIVKKLNSTK